MTDQERKMHSGGISAVLLPCGARKEKLSPALQATQLTRGSQAALAIEWSQRLIDESTADMSRADGMYLGRPHRLARDVVALTGCRYFIASAGLGLVSGSTHIPGYDLTLSPAAEHNLQSRLTDVLDYDSWWNSLQKTPFAVPMKHLAAGRGRILIGLTQPYAALIGKSLASMSPSARARMRIFGFGLNAHLPVVLHPQIITYDARLDRLVPGTRRDGFARALVHFTELVCGIIPSNDVVADQARVSHALSQVATPRRPSMRRRVSDDALRDCISRYVHQERSAAVALRHLRRDAGVACEERRFRRLYQEVSA